MLNFTQRKQRNFDDVRDPDEVLEILKTQIEGKKLHIKYALEKSDLKINEFCEDKSIMVITDPDYVADDVITIYILLDKYMEVDLEIMEVQGPGYFKCQIRGGRKAVRGRRHIRFRVAPDEAVASNFKVSKHTIDLSGFNIPTGIKVILEQFQSQNQQLTDVVKVDVLESGDAIFEQIKKTGKTLFVEDASKMESYGSDSEDFLNLLEILGDDFKGYMKRNIERGYKSIIICPVIYLTEGEQSVPFAYIQLISKKENFTMEKVLDIKHQSFKLVDRIRDANTLFIPVHQHIVDISVGGARLKIMDENLKKYIIKARGFIFDIIFKLQAPITIYGEIRFTFFDDRGNLFAGIDFAGNSSRKNEMKRFYSIMRPMEMEYRNKLLKEMKQKKKMEMEQG